MHRFLLVAAVAILALSITHEPRAQTETVELQATINTMTSEITALQNQMAVATQAMGDLQASLTATDAKSQQALDGTVVLGNNQTTLQQSVSDIESELAAIETGNGGSVWPEHGIFHLNAVPYGAGNKCTTPVGVPVACPADVSDLEGDDTDALIGCDQGTYDGETYTPDPLDTGGIRTCTVAASDPARPHVIHQSKVTVTVTVAP